jgi:hypothetical protein
MSIRCRPFLPSLLIVAAVAIPPAVARTVVFPGDAGMLNVRAFGARGNGKSDDTAAILRAIAASGGDRGPSFWHDRIVYLPDGTYRVSAPLLKRYSDGRFGSGLILIGQSRKRTIIRLENHAPGYGNPDSPRAVVFTSSKLLDGTATSGGKDYTGKGEGNDAYMNFVENLTIDVGSGNPGAIAIDYLGNNIGAIRDVTLRAGPDSGAIGLSMTRKWPGPTLVRQLAIDGFAVGIATAQTEYGLTFDHVLLAGQRVAAIRNDQNALTFRGLTVRGPHPIIVNSGAKGFLAIEDARLPAKTVTTAIRNDGVATLRRVALDGRTVSGVLRGPDLWKPASPPPWLPIMADPPRDPDIPLGRWTSPARYGADGVPGQDATLAIRRAIASGAPVLYLPHGTYAIDGPIRVPPTLRRIVGMDSTLTVVARRPPRFARDRGMLRVASGGPPLFIERLAFDNTGRGRQVAITQSGGRDLILRDVVSAGVTTLDRTETGGRAFLDDICCGPLSVAGPKPVFARQLDTEGGGVRIVDHGSPLTVLGLKTEGVCTIVANSDGARTNIFGGLVYMVRPGAGASVPAFRDDASWLSASFAEESLRPDSRYRIYVAHAAAGRAPVPVTDFARRGFGRFVPVLRDQPRGMNEPRDVPAIPGDRP